MVYLLCDSFIKWQDVKSHKRSAYTDDYIFYAALEWDIYMIFAVVLAGE